nr:immunoglobulin heavy chain junction region [Macaca mulatta]MOV88135.1 immunoglobulin heavy chain junction region [Macaca mulatta]MOV88671.1 immunoglobulin heavy chain junction region [Macaca mulatta]MOV89870.1 immunoglobulin heavy chain junction region [Macaca mulatta]MOV90468.1 immunoglobulin heavy chain junction region [Macaca mulatta]
CARNEEGGISIDYW